MNAEAKFYKMADEWFYRVLELNPVWATQVGEHAYDDRLADKSAGGLEAEHIEMVKANPTLNFFQYSIPSLPVQYHNF